MSVFDLGSVISAHAWSPDRTRVAVSLNDEDVIIYKNADKDDVSKWEKEHILKGHSMVVCGIDWSPLTNKIVTCSHDVNAFVWTYEGRSQKWQPSLSILRINRAALQCRWSPDGTKFAVASGSKVVPVCYYESAQDWWISKMIKKHKSTVIDVAWHPNSQILATASSDFKCRIFSAYVATLEETPAETFFGNISRFSFGEPITEFDSSNGWVESVAWSPSGDLLAFAGHDSSVSLVSFASGQPVCMTIKSNSLPYTCLTFLADNVLVAAGYDYVPDIYQANGKRWAYIGCADDRSSGEKKQVASNNMFASSKAMWSNKVKTGKTENDGGASIKTKHSNVITDICLYGDTNRLRSFDAFSTSGNDGKLILWKMPAIKKAVPSIQL
mmetsp:Transcript_14994/g.16971  ORF Transcript_14994/g.16971 Transcript_14994/m.16971 type:complete len:384 (+) Transcript_14994:266-1417(+)|eukprot:CAMPEP_0184061446 /NCGR_PEP_ID=MMETSP0956-20121227/11502_1 /TAXON_ID=627963 /ORGANISM="Aplanochytrium sp, Strain PBS07" /LENGTH=383 /DNA_ID=CAMNT_0026357913 /DNA_START=277 /DNA_END=1428 /DNA_ORIENTATION=+